MKVTKEYLLSDEVEGYEEFKRGELSVVKKTIVDLIDPKPKMRILDVGFGRGEILRYCSDYNADTYGIDSSKAAYKIAIKTSPNSILLTVNAKKIPFIVNFDRIIISDVIEHMSQSDGKRLIKNLKRILSPNGKIIIHTSPNSVFMNLTYPALKGIIKLMYPETYARLEYQIKNANKNNFHVYEYNPITLARTIKSTGNRFRLWTSKDILRSYKSKYTKSLANSRLIKAVIYLTRFKAFRFFFSNDIYAVVE